MSLTDDETTPTLRGPQPAPIDHFPTDEFTCHDGTPYPAEWENDPQKLPKLKGQLEIIRAAWAKSRPAAPQIVIVCGYRTPAYNARLHAKSNGVAEDSQHPEGTAADIRPMDVRDVPLFYSLIDGLVRSGILDEVGGYAPYPGWVHIDVRPRPPSGHIARWVGEGYGSDR